MTTTVTLSRHAWGTSHSRHARTWGVEVDGVPAASIANGATVSLQLEPGPHTLRVRSMRWLYSPAVSFDAVDGTVARFSCRPLSLTPILLPRWLVYFLPSLIKHDLWIGLRADETPQRGAAATADDHESDASSSRAGAPTTSTPALVVRGLTKRFGQRAAFSDLSFEVAHGEVLGFLGPNGAGKTTTVRTLGTLIAPTSGTATVAGIPLRPEYGEEIRRRISIMPEAPGLYLRLTVTENLEYFASLYGVDDAPSRIRDALDAVNLADRAQDPCGSLSKGLRQRAGLARALLNDPVVLFLDEPTSGLDPVAALEVHELIAGLRRQGVTILLTTHRLEEAEKLCDRVAIVNTTLRTIGRPEDLRGELFGKALRVRTVAPLRRPDEVLGAVPGVESWRSDGPGSYVVAVSDPRAVAPELNRHLVAACADVLFLGERQHSLEDVYVESVNAEVGDEP